MLCSHISRWRVRSKKKLPGNLCGRLTNGINVKTLYFWFLTTLGGKVWSVAFCLPRYTVLGLYSFFLLHLSPHESQHLKMIMAAEVCTFGCMFVWASNHNCMHACMQESTITFLTKASKRMHFWSIYTDVFINTQTPNTDKIQYYNLVTYVAYYLDGCTIEW